MQNETINRLNITSFELLDNFNKEYTYIGEGFCFNVFEKDGRVFKLQRCDYNADQNKEVTLWLSFCLANQESSYVPKIINYQTFQCSNENILVVEVENLLHVSDHIIQDIRDVFGSYLNKDMINLPDSFLMELEEKILSTVNLKEFINSSFFDFFKSLLTNINNFSKKFGDTIFSMDLHFNNFMMRPSTGQLVVIDYFTCALYDCE